MDPINDIESFVVKSDFVLCLKTCIIFISFTSYHGIVVNMMGCDTVESEFKLHSFC